MSYVICMKGNMLLLPVLWLLWSFVIGDEDKFDKILLNKMFMDVGFF